MKIIISIIFFLLAFSVSDYSQNSKLVKIYLNHSQDIIALSTIGVDPEEGIIAKDNTMEIFVNGDEFAKLQMTDLDYDILIDDWNAYYKSLPVLSEQEKSAIVSESKKNFNVDGFGFGSMGGFYTYAEIAANLDSMYSQYPDIVTQKYSIGTSVEGRTIWAVKISDNPNITENEPSVGFDALIHAREPASMSCLMYFMWYVLQNYGTDPVATYLVNNREIYCVPCMNPDGYEYNHQTNPNGGGDWRKSRINSGGGCYGVDLNRNYGYQWGYDNIGSSPYPCDDTYRGTAAFSEPETQAIRDFVAGKNMRTYFNMHAFGNDLLYPWGYINQACPDEETYIDFCQDMIVGNGFVYGTGGYILGYNSNGAARDWLYGEQTIKNKIFGYTIEIGTDDDYFWPPQSRIFPIAENTLQTLVYNSYVAGEYLKLINPNFSNEYFLPNSFVQLTPEYKNKGLSTAYNVKVELSTPNQYINTKTFFSTLDSIEARSTSTFFPSLSFLINGEVPAEEEIPLILTTSVDNEINSVDTINIIIGIPEYVFHDSTDDPVNLWTITATPANPHWEATTSSFYTPPTSYTDSKNGNYVDNATVTMTLTNPVDLSQYTHPILTFRTKYNLEPGYDYGQVEISSNNGTTWTPLEGEYTIPGSGTFQPPGEPLYNGTQSNWVPEEISLASYSSSQVKIRYVLKSDYGITADGWYVDDIGIKVYSAVPVELSSFNAVAQNNDVILNWITATETNNRGFEVQRYLKNTGSGENAQSTEWNDISFIEGNGTSNTLHSYSYTDKNVGSGKYIYRLKQIDFDGRFEFSKEIEININVPVEFSLSQNFPNPFNPVTTIKYSVPSAGTSSLKFVQLKVYNTLGEEVLTLVNEEQSAGRYEIKFDGNNLSSGIYLYKLSMGSFTDTKKMILMK